MSNHTYWRDRCTLPGDDEIAFHLEDS